MPQVVASGARIRHAPRKDTTEFDNQKSNFIRSLAIRYLILSQYLSFCHQKVRQKQDELRQICYDGNLNKSYYHERKRSPNNL